MCWQREMLETVSLGHGYICCVIIISVANGIGVLLSLLVLKLNTGHRSLFLFGAVQLVMAIL